MTCRAFHPVPLRRWGAALLALFAAASAWAIAPEDVRNFDDVFVISGRATERDRVEIRWDIADHYYLYNNRFLRFTVLTDGVTAGEPELPAGKVEFDPLLGENVEKWVGHVTVGLPLTSVPPGIDGVQIRVRSQGCLEKELCYPPTEQRLLVSLPSAPATTGPAAAQETSPLAGLATDPLAGLGRQDGQDEALPPDEAFVYESIGYDAGTALVRFTAQPGYYLYRDRFTFRVVDGDGFSVRSVDLPDGVTKDDPEFGPVEVFYGETEVPVHFNRPAGPGRSITLEAGFQGCRDGDICYPPQHRAVTFEMPASPLPLGKAAGDAPLPAARATGSAAGPAPASEQDRLARLLTASPPRALIAFFVAGLLLAFTPCVFPMVPILSGIIAGQGERLTGLHAFWLSLVYVLAMAVTYTAAGVLAGLFGQNLQALFQNPWIIGGFVLVFVLLALSMFGFYELQVPGRLQSRLAEASGRQRGGHFGGVAIMGLLSALIVGPCVAPPLMAALIVIGASGDPVLGGAALFALSLGMGVPLIVFGVTAGKLVPRAGAWMNAVRNVFGVGLLAVAIWLLERILPGGVIMVLWGVLAIACGVYLGALERVPDGASGWRRLWKSLGLVLLLAGALEIVGAAAGGDYWLRPLDALRGGAPSMQPMDFRRVGTVADLEDAVVQANGAGRGAMLDFYADWCVECIRMERDTFPVPEVRTLLERLQPLQTDVTAYDDDDRALMRRFGIIGPPAILFFDRSGNELRELRLIGYFPPDEFARHLRRVLASQ